MKSAIINFVKNFVCKYLGTVVIEKIVIILLKELVNRSKSNIDDKIYKVIFEQIGGVKDEN